MNTTPTQPKRPFGVYAIIALLLLRVLSISLDLERIRQGLTPLTLPDLDNSSSLVVVIAITIAAILAVCIGLFLLKRWAWIAVMILIGINLLYGIVYYLNGGQPFVSLLLDVISVFYLNQSTVQAAFERRPAPPEVTA